MYEPIVRVADSRWDVTAVRVLWLDPAGNINIYISVVIGENGCDDELVVCGQKSF